MYQGVETPWWLRTAEYTTNIGFSTVNYGWDADVSEEEYGVAPAFRIG